MCSDVIDCHRVSVVCRYRCLQEVTAWLVTDVIYVLRSFKHTFCAERAKKRRMNSWGCLGVCSFGFLGSSQVLLFAQEKLKDFNAPPYAHLKYYINQYN